MKTATITRFWAKVDKSGPCWNWTANKQPFGYGKLTVNRISWTAHRFSWTIHNGLIPDGMCVLHTCDNPSCVNPDHLWLGTKADNNADREAKGRSRFLSGSDSPDFGVKWAEPRRLARCGARNPSAKLTEEQVIEIRSDYVAGRKTIRELAAKHRVSYSAIRSTVRNESYREVSQ